MWLQPEAAVSSHLHRLWGLGVNTLAASFILNEQAEDADVGIQGFQASILSDERSTGSAKGESP